MAVDSAKESNHIIKIWDVKKDRLESMQQKISNTPRLLSKSAGKSSCCIFRVPQSLIDTNGRSYQPHIVSIGPYHHGKPHLQMIEEHKWRFLGSLLIRTQSYGLGLEELLKAIQPLEQRTRECYSENINLSTDEFVEMLVLDGCFIIELFRIMGNLVEVDDGDPLISMSWVYSFFLRDLLRLENQIPFFILQRLFDLSEESGSGSGSSPSLATLAFNFFNAALQRQDENLEKFSKLEGKHLLDFVRSSYFIPDQDQDEDEEEQKQNKNSTSSHLIQCISKLRRAGIKLRPVSSDSFLVVKFRHGVIQMPTITIDDFMSSFLINCVAYEQCHKSCSKHFTTYATLLDCLINTSKDVEYLCDRNIMENYFGTDAEVAKLFNNLGKDVTFDLNTCYLGEFFEDVHQYYKNGWHVQWASFRYTYFDTPWSFISALAALVLLILTVLQTFYTVLGYVRPPP
ncbi:hypothetical protein LguiB_035034 [Lonicera macranthoides]